MKKSIQTAVKGLALQVTYNVRIISVLGFILFGVMAFQCFTGIMLAMSLVNDSMLVVASRETEDMDALYTDDFFWLHERGVELIYTLSFFHLLRKYYLRTNYHTTETAWTSGVFLFYLLHVIIFSGLVLCCSHLSEITLKIASNIAQTMVKKMASIGWWLFTNDSLNTDTLIRIMYLHYISPFLTLILALSHLDDMHYAHKDSTRYDQRRVMYAWTSQTVKKELMLMLQVLNLIVLLTIVFKPYPEPLAYEMFMWGEIGSSTNPRFLSVAPHWYFRVYMAWLIHTPHHYLGIFGLIYMILALYFQAKLMGGNDSCILESRNYQPIERSIIFNSLFAVFIWSCLYVASYLPYGRYFTQVGGNIATTACFIFIVLFLTVPIFDQLLSANRRGKYWLTRVQ